MSAPLVEVSDLRKSFAVRKSLGFGWLGGPAAQVKAVDGVSFTVAAGELIVA